MSRESSPAARDDRRMQRWANTAPETTANGCVYQVDLELAERLAWLLCSILSRGADAAERAMRTDTPIAWAWVARWALLGRQVEVELSIADGSLPVREGAPS